MKPTADGDLVGISTEPLRLEPLLAAVAGDAFGAIATFLGTVRSPNAGKVVRYIDYEGYDAMVERQMTEITVLLRGRYDVGRLALVHRLARLEPGETSIAIVVAAPHRRGALDACSDALELCKERLPIWKFEVTDEGGAYVRGHSRAGVTL